MTDTARIRAATPDDAEALVRLIGYAGEGLPQLVWAGMAEPGESPTDVGHRRARRLEGAFSYRNAHMAVVGGASVATLIGYPLATEAEPVDLSELPPMFRPLQALEEHAPGTWYVNVLATEPAYRGQGIGAQLLAHAETLARGAGSAGLSLIVRDRNRARRLYQRAGYGEAARRPIVRDHGWTCDGADWVLLVKRF
jgi:ribosomal protein S18 acetylase RimI-like enzyme